MIDDDEMWINLFADWLLEGSMKETDRFVIRKEDGFVDVTLRVMEIAGARGWSP